MADEKDQSGEQQERTEWHRVVLWGKLGEVAEQYLRKGSQVYIEGRIETRKWQDQGGQDRYTTEIRALDMQMLGGRGSGGGGGGLAVQPIEGIDSYAGGSLWYPSGGAAPLTYAVANTDAVAIRYMDLTSSIGIVKEMPSTAARLFIDQGHDLSENDIIVVSDCDSADIKQITSINVGAEAGRDGLNHNSGAGSPGNSTQ